MLKIVLCDDDEHLLRLENETLVKEIEYLEIDGEVVCQSTSGENIIHYLMKNEDAYLCFVDLDFGEGKRNGIDLAGEIKRISPQSKIVFVTNHEEMAMQVLKSGVEPLGFLEKTAQFSLLRNGYRKYIKIAQSCMNYQNNLQNKTECITLNLGYDETISIQKETITYLETEKNISHGLTYHTIQGSHITVRGTIQEASEMLGKYFMKCHRCILVNLDQCIGLEEGEILLATGERISCALRLRSEVIKRIRNK